MLPRNRRPTPPGEILRYEFLEPLELTQKALALALGITRVRLSEIVRGKRGITPDTALRLGRFFDTTPEFWLGLQTDLNLWDTLQAHGAEYDKIKPGRVETMSAQGGPCPPAVRILRLSGSRSQV